MPVGIGKALATLEGRELATFTEAIVSHTYPAPGPLYTNEQLLEHLPRQTDRQSPNRLMLHASPFRTWLTAVVVAQKDTQHSSKCLA